MTVKEAIKTLLDYPQDMEIQMYCSHDGKIEKATITPHNPIISPSPKATFYPTQKEFQLAGYNLPSVVCSS